MEMYRIITSALIISLVVYSVSLRKKNINLQVRSATLYNYHSVIVEYISSDNIKKLSISYYITTYKEENFPLDEQVTFIKKALKLAGHGLEHFNLALLENLVSDRGIKSIEIKAG